MKSSQSQLRQQIEPFLKIVLDEEKKNFTGDLESWSAHEAKVTTDCMLVINRYRERLEHACALIQQRFGF